MSKGLKASRLVVVDLEATCWEKYIPDKISEIIEIGICTVDFQTCSIVDVGQFYVRPLGMEIGDGFIRTTGVDISEYCTNLTGITTETIKEKGHPLNEVLNTIADIYPLRSQAWASWGNYDRIQLERECVSKDIRYPFSTCHINLKHIHAFLNGLNKGVGMEKALRGYGIELEGRHHCGMWDSYNTAKIALRMFKGKKINSSG